MSSLYCRTSHLQGRRALRHAAIDAGAATANLHATAQGLGISTITLLRLNDAFTRALVGLEETPEYEEFEAVHGLVAWGDNALARADLSGPAEDVLPLIRPPVPPTPAFGSVMAAHWDCVARGVGVRELRPPLTDLTPVPATVLFLEQPSGGTLHSRSLRAVLLDDARPTLQSKPISRTALSAISRAGFRGGTFAPLRPDGPHLATVRPFWIVINVIGLEPGIWWHDPILDRYALLNRGGYGPEAMLCTRSRLECADAAAVCVTVANLTKLLGESGPDLYRLAHLEAGLAGQRIRLAADSIGATAVSFGDFHDALWKQFFGLAHTGWEPLLVTAVGGRPNVDAGEKAAARGLATLEFRD